MPHPLPALSDLQTLSKASNIASVMFKRNAALLLYYSDERLLSDCKEMVTLASVMEAHLRVAALVRIKKIKGLNGMSRDEKEELAGIEEHGVEHMLEDPRCLSKDRQTLKDTINSTFVKIANCSASMSPRFYNSCLIETFRVVYKCGLAESDVFSEEGKRNHRGMFSPIKSGLGAIPPGPIGGPAYAFNDGKGAEIKPFHLILIEQGRPKKMLIKPDCDETMEKLPSLLFIPAADAGPLSPNLPPDAPVSAVPVPDADVPPLSLSWPVHKPGLSADTEPVQATLTTIPGPGCQLIVHFNSNLQSDGHSILTLGIRITKDASNPKDSTEQSSDTNEESTKEDGNISNNSSHDKKRCS